jgi:hypothetical protein
MFCVAFLVFYAKHPEHSFVNFLKDSNGRRMSNFVLVRRLEVRLQNMMFKTNRTCVAVIMFSMYSASTPVADDAVLGTSPQPRETMQPTARLGQESFAS